MMIRRILMAVALVTGAGLSMRAEPLHAQARCDTGVTPVPSRVSAVAVPHPAPLDRRVSLQEMDIVLSSLLERLTDLTGVRFSYSSDALELDRRVCIVLRDVPLGELLSLLLDGSGLEPRSVSTNHVALVPVPAHESVGAATAGSPAEPIPLEPVHLQVERSALGGTARSTRGTVITGEQLATYSAGTVAGLLNGVVPGFWVWGADGAGPGHQLGSMRGAASFGGSAPKVYLDGIELANPLTLARLAPETIDYIEVISGPQGAALYGPNATSGVIDIRTRSGSTSAGRPQVRLRGEVGVGASSVAVPLRGEQAVGIDLGNERTSARLDLLAGVGSGAPGSASGERPRRFAADLTGRVLGEHSVLTLTARYLADQSATHAGSAEPGHLLAFGAPETSVREGTVGLTAALHPGGRWTHTFVAGVDAFALERPVHSQAGSDAPQLDATATARATFRLTSTRELDLGPHRRGLLSFAADQSLLRERSAVLPSAFSPLFRGSAAAVRSEAPAHPSNEAPTAAANVSGPDFEKTRANTGLGAQTELWLGDRWQVHGGLRFDRFGPLFDAGPWVAQPLLGASWRTGRGPVKLTFRSAYGRAIRWQEQRSAENYEPASAGYVPVEATFEQQTGIEAGMDVQLSRWLSLHLTRFDQTASGLSQQVAAQVQPSSDIPTAPYAGNVGEIRNKGWELQGTVRRGAFSIDGALSLVDSRVARTAAHYIGELEPGDRMLNVPARVIGLTARWNARSWSALISATQAADWIGYEQAVFAGSDSVPAPPHGSALRDYWRAFDQITLLGASAHRTILPGLDLTIGAQNLLNATLETVDPWMAVPGRTVNLGFRFSF